MADVSRLRDIAVVGGHHAGKTTLVEAILDACDAIPRRGSVADGTATTDYEAECIEHGQSTCVGFAHAQCSDVDLHLIDCPGFVDFFEETKLVLAGADAALVVIEPDPAKLPQIAGLIAEIEARRMPHLFVVNKLDRPGADFAGTLAELQRLYGRHVVAEQLPIGSGPAFRGFVDLTEIGAFAYDGNGKREIPVPEEMREEIHAQRAMLLEALGDFDDHLLEELLEGIEPSRDEIESDLCANCAHDRVIPVVVTSALTGAGIGALLDCIVRQLPSPLVSPRLDSDGTAIVPDAAASVVAHVLKTVVHPQAGRLSIVRILAGTLTASTTLAHGTNGAPLPRIGGLFRLQGKKQEPVARAGPGEIVALARLEGALTGETLFGSGPPRTLPTHVPAEPVFALAIRPRERLDEAKLSQMLARLVDEDPTLRVARAPLTNELQLLGNGEVHVTTATQRLSRKYHLALETALPAIPYRETLLAAVDVHARYKHQTGGHGQFADVTLRVEPRERGHGVTFEERIVGGVVPRAFFPAVEKGVREALARGIVAGYPVVDVHVVLVDGAYHDVDSSEQSFKTAAGMAIRDALARAGCVVLEPIARVRTTVPSSGLSSAVALITAKRGQILAYDPLPDGSQAIVASVPQAELGRYITELRTATQGLGTFTATHERFDLVPQRVAASLVHA